MFPNYNEILSYQTPDLDAATMSSKALAEDQTEDSLNETVSIYLLFDRLINL